MKSLKALYGRVLNMTEMNKLVACEQRPTFISICTDSVMQITFNCGFNTGNVYATALKRFNVQTEFLTLIFKQFDYLQKAQVRLFTHLASYAFVPFSLIQNYFLRTRVRVNRMCYMQKKTLLRSSIQKINDRMMLIMTMKKESRSNE